MATNEILPFASTNTGTNLLTQAEYAADAQRTIGHQPGIARSKLENKALRQASLMAAGLAEFIADYQANNVTDSLTAQQVADYLLAAITANIPVVPDASTTVKGIIEIATAAEAQTYSSSLLAITPATLNQALKGSNQAINSFGYQRFPGGLIIQWGTVSLADEENRLITLPTAYTSNHVLALGGLPPSEKGNWVYAFAAPTSLTQIQVGISNQDIRGMTMNWLSMGF